MKQALLSLISLLNPPQSHVAPAAPILLCAILDYPPPQAVCGANGIVITSPGGPLTYSFTMTQVPCFSGCSSVIGSISK